MKTDDNDFAPCWRKFSDAKVLTYEERKKMFPEMSREETTYPPGIKTRDCPNCPHKPKLKQSSH